MRLSCVGAMSLSRSSKQQHKQNVRIVILMVRTFWIASLLMLYRQALAFSCSSSFSFVLKCWIICAATQMAIPQVSKSCIPVMNSIFASPHLLAFASTSITLSPSSSTSSVVLMFNLKPFSIRVSRMFSKSFLKSGFLKSIFSVSLFVLFTVLIDNMFICYSVLFARIMER